MQQAVYQLLGGAFRHRLRAYTSHMLDFFREASAQRASAGCDEGFIVVKFGWEPFGRDRQVDLPRGRAIRRAAGDRVEVMIDTGLA